MKFPKLNKEEIAVGSVVALAYMYFTGLLTIATVPLCALLWALGGAEKSSKAWRRIGVPIVLCGAIAYKDMWLTPLLSILPLLFVLRMGYGVPDGTDQGSALGRWWTTKLTGLKAPFIGITVKQMTLIDWYVRGTIGFLIGISLLTTALINLPQSLLSIVLITLAMPIVVRVVK